MSYKTRAVAKGDDTEYAGMHGEPQTKTFWDPVRYRWRRAVLIDVGYGFRHPRSCRPAPQRTRTAGHYR